MTASTPKSISTILVDILFQLETSNDSKIDPDYAVSIMEDAAASLQEMDSGELSRFLDMVSKSAASEKNEDKKLYMENFADNFGLV